MSAKWVSRLAWGLGAMISAGALFALASELASGGMASNIVRLASEVGWSLFPVVYSLLAALILARQPRNLIGWLLMLPAAMWVISVPVNNYLDSFSTTAPPASLPILLSVAFSNWGWVLFIFPMLLIPLVFPNGRLPSPRWRWVLWASIGMCLFFIFIASFAQRMGPLEGASWEITNPIGFIPEDAIEVIILPWIFSLGLLTLACLASLFVRFHRAGATEREQIKWLLYACGVFAAVYVSSLVFNFNDMGGIVYDAFELLFTLSIFSIPVAIATAILRYKLWDIDVIIRRTLVYGALSVTLALVYFGSVVLLQGVSQAMGGENESPVAVVISTLAIAAMFAPLRRRIQSDIDRRFYRQKYDARRIADEFATRSRDEVELDVLTGYLLESVEKTLQPEHVSVWLTQVMSDQSYRGGSET